MKLSTIILIITVLVFFGALTVHNLSLRAAYLEGIFRDRFGEHTFRKLDDVKQVHLKAINMMGVTIEHGEREGVWIGNNVKDLVKVSQDGETVVIDFRSTDPKKYRHIGGDDVVMIVNKLNKVSTSNYQMKGQHLEYYGGDLSIKGLSGDSFELVMTEQTNAHLEGSKFKVFNAVVGGDRYWSSLIVSGDNRLDTAYFDVRKSSLELRNPVILVPHYKFGDSSRIELWGKSARGLVR